MKKSLLFVGLFLFCFSAALLSQAKEPSELDRLREAYQAYEETFESIQTTEDITRCGYEIVSVHSFPIVLESFGEEEVWFLPAIEKTCRRMAVFIADSDGRIVCKTNQLETNHKWKGKLEQPTKEMVSVSFQDLNADGRKDIILITDCQNQEGGPVYKVGDVLFQGDRTLYRDWRVSDRLNRFSMNKSVDLIVAHVRDGRTTEALYTATTLDGLLVNGFQIVDEQCYYRSFEKLGYLRVVPGYIRIAEYDVFMIYLVNEQGYIVWSFQPMQGYDNLYALKGMTCRDLDGDGMKDILVLARYSYEDSNHKMMVDTKCNIYYQRTDGFAEEKDFETYYQCTTADTVSGLVEVIRKYWGWAGTENTNVNGVDKKK